MNMFEKSSMIPLIGRTPVIELHDPLIPKGKKLFLKLEMYNPNFSVKDRSALGLITKALSRGDLRPGGTVIESTSGNLGKSLAMLGAIMGFQVVVVVDLKVPKSVLNWYRAYGARLELVDKPDVGGSFQRARIARVQELLKKYPDAYWPNQYDNTDNRDWHAEITGPEIIEDAARYEIDAIVGSVSTGGHLCGIGTAVKRTRPDIKMFASDVEGSAIFGGSFKPYHINGLGLGWRAKNTSLDVFDGVMVVSDEHAVSICRLMAREHGLLFGGSSGVVIFAALALLHGGQASCAMAVIPDSGVSYLDQIYDEEWTLERNLRSLSREQLGAEIGQAELRPCGG